MASSWGVDHQDVVGIAALGLHDHVVVLPVPIDDVDVEAHMGRRAGLELVVRL